MRTSHVTVVALVCAVILAPARGDEPRGKNKMVQKVYAVADLVVPIKDYVGTSLVPPANFAPPIANVMEPMACDLEIMCQQPADEPCCKGAQSCCHAAAPTCCPNGACCPDGPCCPNAGCCPNGACFPNGACCSEAKTVASEVANWTAAAAPEWCKAAAAKTQTHDVLVKLITNTVCPKCWTENGGTCTVDYYATGMGLVVNAPADVQEQVADLLEALRHLQDIEVACEVKFVSMTDDAVRRVFGGTSNVDGGPPVFFDAPQLRNFLKTVQGDPKTAVMCAPKLTVFNGQKTSIRCTDDQFFVTSVNTVKFGGQVVYVPVNSPVSLGYQTTVCPTVSADHKFVRCQFKAELCNLASPKVPLYPVSTLITPVFEGGAQGPPVPFTQFIQQPNIIHRNVEKSLIIPDGGTAVLYAGKCEKEDPAADDGPCAPFFDWIYDLVDLFSPPAETPTVTEHLFVLVTPRVIVNEREVVEARPMPVGPSRLPPLSCVGVGPVTGNLAADLDIPICPAATAQPGQVVRQCAAMADAPCCQPAPTAVAPCCSAPRQCAGAQCAMPQATPPCPRASGQQQVQLDVCILSMDPAAWDQPVTAAWSDLSPKTCGGDQTILTLSPEELHRFCESMRAQGAGKLLAEPRIVTQSGRPATFLSGGQQAVPQVTGVGASATIVGTRFEPFGTQLTFLPVVMDCGRVKLEMDASLSKLTQSNGFSIDDVVVLGRDERRTHTVVTMSPGKTALMHCRDADGRDVMVTVTPYLVNTPPEACMPPPMPGSFGAVFASPPVAVPCQTAPMACPAPMPAVPCAAAVPAPPYEPQLTTGQFAPPGVIDPKLDRLLTKYRWACEDGDAAEARNLAQQCLMIDPTCFGK